MTPGINVENGPVVRKAVCSVLSVLFRGFHAAHPAGKEYTYGNSPHPISVLAHLGREANEATKSNWIWDMAGMSFITPVISNARLLFNVIVLPTTASVPKYFSAMERERTTVYGLRKTPSGEPAINGNEKNRKKRESA